ncbi:DUF7827 domain-containing protein [Halorussus salinus]|uniref:DUF7827 domain-containing protein n=1 Tax=Halorussus salinus TaxID=1364935 RepID=UPI00109241AC|nr:BGTF surface domain-containing protein [Halorussus salinus]
MTRTRKSVLLTALLVVSAVTAGVTGGAVTGAETAYQAQDDGEEFSAVDSGETFWQGQFLQFSANQTNSGEVWAVRRVQNGEVGSLETEVLLDGSGSAIFSTSNLDGQFVVVNEDDEPVVLQNGSVQGTGSVGEASFEIANQTLNASFADRTVLNDDSTDALTDLRLQSNRAGYGFYLFSENLSNQQLADVFESVEVRDGRAVATREAGGNAFYEANFSGVEPGTYDVRVVTADGTAQDTASVTVSEPVDGTASLGNATYTEERGDVVRFNVTFDGTDSAIVQLGSRQVNYLSRFTVVDENGDGTATVEMNTFRAGISPDSPGISVVGEDSYTDFQLETNPIPGRLDAATYPIQLTVGASRTAVGSILLTERSTEGIQTWTAPDRTNVNTAAQIGEVAAQDSDIAFQDWAIVQVQASGLYGYVQNMSDLNNNQTGVSMTLTNTGGLNVPPTEVPLNRGRLVVDESGNQFFLVIDSDRLEEGAQYSANFTISSANPYVEEGNGTSLVSNFTVVNRSTSFDQPVQVPASSDATVSGTSTLAPGTELNIEAFNTGRNPFLKRQTATVSEEGTWEATFDFSDVPTNTSVTMTIDEPRARVTGVVGGEATGQAGGAADGEAGDQDTGAADETTTTAEETAAEETTTEMETETAAEETTTAEGAGGAETTEADGETTTEETATETEAAVADDTTTVAEAGTAPAPGFGVGAALVALAAVLLAGAAFVVRRR